MKFFAPLTLLLSTALLGALAQDDVTTIATPGTSVVTTETSVPPTDPTITTTETVTRGTTTAGRYTSKFRNTECSEEKCKMPECVCLNDKPPKGLSYESIPQFITLTFDGAVTVTNFPYYKELFKFTNPDKCAVRATFFVSHVDTNYKLVHELHRHGNEIGAHSISKNKNNYQDYWKNLDYEGWRAEFGGQKRILAKLAEIPEADIKGARAPNLQTAGNITIAALVHEKYEYDCSSPSRRGIETPFYPYTLDFGGQRDQDCPVLPCVQSTERYPGFWEVLMNDLNVRYQVKNQTLNRECATAAGCILFNEDGSVNYHPSEDQIFELFKNNFERYYNGNRAPFPLYLSEDWIKNEGQRKGLFKFIEYISQHKDVYIVNMNEIIEWMKSPANIEDYEKHTKCPEVKKTNCAMTSDDLSDLSDQFKHYCDYTEISELDGLTKRMIVCDDVECPNKYPWVGF